MIGEADPSQIYSKDKAITALFPYAILQERNGQRREVFDIFLRVTRASRGEYIMWSLVEPLIIKLLSDGSPVSVKRAVILVSPHLPQTVFDDGHSVQLWAAAASAVPYTDDIGQSVVRALLRSACEDSSHPLVPIGMWSWLNKRSLFPPGRRMARDGHVGGAVRTIRALGDIETLTSCLYLVWSECTLIYPRVLEEMCALIREDFSGIWVGYHREDLLRRLDHILGQLDLGLGYLRRHEPSLNESIVHRMKSGYGRLKQVLLEMGRESIDNPKLIREFFRLAILFDLMTPVGRPRVPPDVHVCDSSLMSVVARPDFFSRPTLPPILPVLITYVLVILTLIFHLKDCNAWSVVTAVELWQRSRTLNPFIAGIA